MLSRCPAHIIPALLVVRDALDVTTCWHYAGRFHFRLPDEPGWTVAISAESAGRIRVDRCHLTAPRDTRWVTRGDRARLAAVAQEMAATTVAA